MRAAEALKLGILDGLSAAPFTSHDDVIASASEFILSDKYEAL